MCLCWCCDRFLSSIIIYLSTIIQELVYYDYLEWNIINSAIHLRFFQCMDIIGSSVFGTLSSNSALVYWVLAMFNTNCGDDPYPHAIRVTTINRPPNNRKFRTSKSQTAYMYDPETHVSPSSPRYACQALTIGFHSTQSQAIRVLSLRTVQSDQAGKLIHMIKIDDRSTDWHDCTRL